MGGSPRVKAAANIRLDHPQITTEEAMKLVGYSENEARDPRRQSNVRQKAHRLSKSRKRPVSSAVYYNTDPKRISFTTTKDDMQHQEQAREPATNSSMHLVQNEQTMMESIMPMDTPFPRNTHNMMSSSASSHTKQQSRQMYINQHPTPLSPVDQFQHHQNHKMQMQMLHQQQMQQEIQKQSKQQSLPYSVSIRPRTTSSESAKPPGGSLRIERAANIRLDDQTISTEEAMKLAGFSVPDAKNKKNVRQKTHRLTIERTPKVTQRAATTAAQQQDVPLSIKFELARLEKKIDDVADRLENQIEEKIQKLGNRIDEKISTIIQLLELQPGVQVQRIRRNEYQVQERGRDPRSVQQDPIASDDILADCHLSSSSST